MHLILKISTNIKLLSVKVLEYKGNTKEKPSEVNDRVKPKNKVKMKELIIRRGQ